MASSEPSPASPAFDLPERESEADGTHATEIPAGPSPLPMSAPQALSENSGPPAGARRANSRRAPQFNKVMVLTLTAYMVVLAIAGLWFHRRLMTDIDARLQSVRSTVPPLSAPATDAANTIAELKRLETVRESDSKKKDEALGVLSKRLGDLEAQNQKQAVHLEELGTALSEAKAALKEKKTAPPPAPSLPASEGLAPAQAELVLLKERNRLTSYADEAIATGARAPYERLWEALDDPRLSSLAHAARSEILRVQNFYLGGSRIDRYDIPVATYFPEQSALKDSQLKDDQLMKLLREKKNPWEVRMKAANLLGMRHSAEAGDALVAAVKSDENLDVVKEATFSFEQMTGFRSRIFDASSLEQWWKDFKATPTPPKPKAKPATGKAANAPAKEKSKSAAPKSPEKETESKKP